MDTLKTPFLPPPPPPPPAERRRRRHRPLVAAAAAAPISGTTGPYRRQPRRPLSDDDARRLIHAKAQYLSRLRRNQGSAAQTPRWIRRTPDQMARLIQDDRDGHLYGRHVVAAIRTVRGLAERPEGDYDMREVMGSFVAKLTWREMCVVLKEQKGWRQARDFFGWMKLQLCYRPSAVVYTIILRIYGQVGKIKLAERIFLEMLEAGCEPDEVACGTMLCAYARWGRHKDMMLFYSAVRRRDILPSIAVFNFMISSLQKKKLHGQVIQLWKEMLDARIEPNLFTYTIVINSYVKEGVMEDALYAFWEMKKNGFIPEEATYGLLISLTAKNGRDNEALALYEEMKTQRIMPSNYTYSSLLVLHYKNSDYSQALSLFAEMRRKKITPDEVIYGILIRIYGKLGLYEDAQQTFADIEKYGLLSDEKTYLAMAQVHINAGNHGKALELLELMRSRNVELTKFSHSAFLRCFVANEDVKSAEIMFHTLSRTGTPDAVCCSYLLNLYIKLGLLEKAKSLISQMRNVRLNFDQELYRAAVEVYCREGMLAEAEQLVEEMEDIGLTVDKIIKRSLMTMYSNAHGLQKAEALFKTLEQPDATALGVMLCLYLENGYMHKSKEIFNSLLDSSGGFLVANQLIRKFAREGDVDKAESLYSIFIELGLRPDDAAMSSMITLYGRHQKLRQAQELYAYASNSSEIGRVIYMSGINAYCKCGVVDDANHLYHDMIDQGHAPDAVTVSVLVNTLAKQGKYQQAECIIQKSFDGNMELDTVAYNTYIKAMLDSGKLHSAISIYDRMISSRVPPSLQTVNTMISVYGHGGQLNKAVEMFSTAESLGFSIDEKAYTNMINYYGKAGRIEEASMLFSKMQEDGIRPGKISYNTMINAYATVGHISEAETLLINMQRGNHSPDSLTYLGLIRGYTESHRYSEAEEIVHNMCKDGISPSCSHFNHLILSFTKDGSLTDAERVYGHMRQAGLDPDLTCCRAMLRAYMDYGLVEEGISFFETTNGLVKPDGYILSAAVHFYKNVGNESRADHVLDVMNMHGLVFLRNLDIGLKSRASENLVQ